MISANDSDSNRYRCKTQRAFDTTEIPSIILTDESRQFVDSVALVEEAETRAAVRALAVTQQLIVEGSGAVGIAALFSHRLKLDGQQVAVVLSGGNIDLKLLKEILNEEDAV